MWPAFLYRKKTEFPCKQFGFWSLLWSPCKVLVIHLRNKIMGVTTVRKEPFMYIFRQNWVNAGMYTSLPPEVYLQEEGPLQSVCVKDLDIMGQTGIGKFCLSDFTKSIKLDINIFPPNIIFLRKLVDIMYPLNTFNVRSIN